MSIEAKQVYEWVKTGHWSLREFKNWLTEAEKQEPVALKRQLVKIHDALGAHLGDTDPYIPEDMTDDEVCEYEPVFWAAKEIAALIGDAPWTDYNRPQPKAEKQEPVAWCRYEDGMWVYYETKAWDDLHPLYTHPQPKREWVGLTQEELLNLGAGIVNFEYAAAIEAKLKELNT